MDTSVLLGLRNFIAPEIVYGPGALGLVGRHAANLGATKVFLVTDAGVKLAGGAAKVEASLREAGLPYVVFDGVTPNPKDHEVMAGATAYGDGKCDLIVAVGGGSPMDCAKGVGVVTANGGHVLEYEGVDAVQHAGPPPQRYDELAQALGCGGGSRELVERLASLRHALGVERHWRDLGLTHGDITRRVENALHDPCLATNPRVPGVDTVVRLYNQVLWPVSYTHLRAHET